MTKLILFGLAVLLGAALLLLGTEGMLETHSLGETLGGLLLGGAAITLPLWIPLVLFKRVR